MKDARGNDIINSIRHRRHNATERAGFVTERNHVLMRKKITVTAVFFLLTLLLTGCLFHKHEWAEATCEEPKTCVKCGETEGKALGHDVIEATCTEPQTCARCGKTKGKPLGHDWEEATCTEPKTCKRCGETEGEPLGHEWIPATVEAPKTCKRCGETEGDPIPFEILDLSFLDAASWSYVANDHIAVAEYEDPKNYWHYEFYDLNGKLVHQQDLDCRKSGSSYKGHSISCVGDCYLLASGDTKNSEICVYDYDFNLILRKEMKSNGLFSNQFPTMDSVTLGTFKRVYNDATGKTLFYFDLRSGREVEEAEFTAAAENENFTPPFYSEQEYSVVEEQNTFDGYLYGSPDGSEWGYLDENGNILATYVDATSFNEFGYALVTEDGKNYSVIDADLNVVGTDVIRGASAYLCSDRGSVFGVEDKNGNRTYVRIGE